MRSLRQTSWDTRRPYACTFISRCSLPLLENSTAKYVNWLICPIIFLSNFKLNLQGSLIATMHLDLLMLILVFRLLGWKCKKITVDHLPIRQEVRRRQHIIRCGRRFHPPILYHNVMDNFSTISSITTIKIKGLREFPWLIPMLISVSSVRACLTHIIFALLVNIWDHSI